MIQALIQFFAKHPYVASIVGSWISNNIMTVMVSSLPAPGKDSSAKYVYWFKVSNGIIGNLQRAQSTAIEKSPNWQDAMDVRLQQLGVIPPAPVAPKGTP